MKVNGVGDGRFGDLLFVGFVRAMEPDFPKLMQRADNATRTTSFAGSSRRSSQPRSTDSRP